MYMYLFNIIIINFFISNVILIIIVIDFFFLIDEFNKEIILKCRIGFISLLVLEDKVDDDEGEDD